MRFLPTNVLRLRTLRREIALRLLALPYACTLAAISVFPNGQQIFPGSVATQIAGIFSVSPGQTESCATAMAAFAFMCLGYLLGWGLNFFALAVARSFGPSLALQIIAYSRLPTSWQNKSANEIIVAAQNQLADQRAFAKSMGPVRFIVVRGGLLFGMLVFLLLHVVLNLVQSQPIALAQLPWKFCLWFILCTANAAWSWYELMRTNALES